MEKLLCVLEETPGLTACFVTLKCVLGVDVHAAENEL